MATVVGMPSLHIPFPDLPRGGGGEGMGLLDLILQPKRNREMNMLFQILADALKTGQTQEQIAPSPIGISPEAGYEPGIYSQIPTGQPGIGQNILQQIMGSQQFSPQTKMAGMKLFEMLQPQKKEFLTLGPGQEAIDITTKERIKGPAPKEHWQAVQGEENFWIFNPDTGQFKETNTAIKGKKEFSDPYKDEQGNLVQKNLKTDEIKVISKATEAEAPKTRELKHGKEIITQEYNPQTKTWKEIARGPREIEKPSEELKATKAKEVRSIVDQRFGLSKENPYENLDEGTKPIYDSILEKAQKNSHTMDTAEAVNKAIKELRESKTIKVYEHEPTLNPETNKWEFPEGKGYTGRWKYWGEKDWRGESGKKQEEKRLYETTARTILKEADGDKNKAREIAKQRGYKF